jgi:hypothetical protein
LVANVIAGIREEGGPNVALTKEEIVTVAFALADSVSVVKMTARSGCLMALATKPSQRTIDTDGWSLLGLYPARAADKDRGPRRCRGHRRRRQKLIAGWALLCRLTVAVAIRPSVAAVNKNGWLPTGSGYNFGLDATGDRQCGYHYGTLHRLAPSYSFGPKFYGMRMRVSNDLECLLRVASAAPYLQHVDPRGDVR